MLLAQLDGVVHRYAPPAAGSHTTHGIYYTLNPGRADRSVGSFCIHMTGPKAGRWVDYAMAPRAGERTSCASGDVLDLIGLSLGLTDPGEILREARTFLGLQNDSPEARRAREEAARKAAARREAQAREDARAAEKRARLAQRIWLEASPELRGSPVDGYLREARGIDLARLGRAPGALRFHPACWYSHTDPDTGEVIEGRHPAMVAAVSDVQGNFAAVHRTYLGRTGGAWAKADLPETKKVLGDYRGAAINLWRGIGPRGGKPASLPKCPPGSHVWIAEGIEDALSAVILRPELRVLACISLSNMGAVKLPANVHAVTLIADRDENATAREQLRRAVDLHRQDGRRVSVWQNRWGGKDLNDALRAALAAEQEQDRGAA